MLLPASSEFAALCQSQVDLLSQTLGAALSIVYLTEEISEVVDAKLVPIVAYPEAARNWPQDQVIALLQGIQAQGIRGYLRPRLLPAEAEAASSEATREPLNAPIADGAPAAESRPLESAQTALLRQQQMLVPLMHGEVVMGLLVTARVDRPWSSDEQVKIQHIAHTLAVACLLDQRSQWLQQEVRQRRLLDQQKHELLDNLLHQFRNPLTALRTFGKLLLKRLKAEDLPNTDANRPDLNRTAVEGIIRESDRLQELLKLFDVAIDLDAPSLPLLNQADDSASQAPAQSIDPPALAAGPALLPSGPSLNSPALPGHASLFVGRTLQPAAHALSDLLRPMLQSAAAIAQERQLHLEVDLPTAPPVWVDDTVLREVLNNLLDNALKYTPAGGSVLVRLLPLAEADAQVLVIADTGVGIPPEDQAHLFERHYRGVQSQTDIPGTGLGLAIARDLLMQMQGTIEIFSPATVSQIPGLPSSESRPGTAAVVRLPLAEVNHSPEA